MLIMIFGVLAAAFAQGLAPPVAAFAQAKLPVLASVAAYYALRRTLGLAVGAAVAAGLVQDAMSAAPLGQSAALFLAAALLAQRYRIALHGDSIVAASLVAALAAGAITVASGLALALDEDAGLACPAWWIFLKGGGTALLGLAVAPVVCLGLRRVEQFVGLVARPRKEFPWRSPLDTPRTS